MDWSNVRRPTTGKEWLLVGLAIGIILSPVLAAALSNSVPIQNGVTLQAPDGPAVTLTEAGDVNLTSPFPDANTVDVTADFGNATFSSSGQTNVTVVDLEGPQTKLTNLDVASNELTINPGDKQAVKLLGGVSSFNFTSMAVDDGNVDFVIDGSGSPAITVTGLPANTDLALVNQVGTTLASTTSDNNGQAIWANVPLSKHSVQIQSTSATGGSGAWCGQPELVDYYTDFSGQNPIKAVACPFIQSEGIGMGIVMFSMFFFGFIGLSLSYRVQHPGPLLVAGILTAGVVTLSLPGIMLKILAVVLFFGLAMLGMYLYQRAQGTL